MLSTKGSETELKDYYGKFFTGTGIESRTSTPRQVASFRHPLYIEHRVPDSRSDPYFSKQIFLLLFIYIFSIKYDWDVFMAIIKISLGLIKYGCFNKIVKEIPVAKLLN